jgi:hypothetical protein
MTQLVGLTPVPGLTLEAKLIRLVAALGILLAIIGMAYCQGRSDGKAHVELANQKAINAAITQDRASAERRQQEEITQAEAAGKEKAAYDNAIAAAPGGVNSPAAHALACQRLREAFGAGSPNVPASCRPSSGDTAKAAPAVKHR